MITNLFLARFTVQKNDYGPTNRPTNGRTDQWADQQTNGWTDQRTNQWTDQQMDKASCTDAWMHLKSMNFNEMFYIVSNGFLDFTGSRWDKQQDVSR